MAKAKPAPAATPTSLTVERAALLAALTAVTKAVETRNTIPILANVLLSVTGDRLTIRGTDLDIEITTSVSAQGSLPDTTAPARTLLDIVRKLPAGAEVTLELDGDTLLVKSGRSRFKIAVLPASDFPTIDVGKFTASFEADLAAWFAQVSFAMSSEETRYYLNGIYLRAVKGGLDIVATDGHRLARLRVPSVGDIPPAIVPRKTVGIVPEGVVKVDLSDTKIRITAGETVLVSKLIEATYPDYERVIPQNNDKLLTIDQGEVVAALERVSVVADPRNGNAVRLDLAPDIVTLTTKSATDTATEELAAEYGSEPVSVGVNVDYLSDILRAAGGSRVTLAIGGSDGMSPILIKGDNDNWTGVQVPMLVAV